MMTKRYGGPDDSGTLAELSSVTRVIVIYPTLGINEIVLALPPA
jgi:hypothetical protein